jgi:hypothetical protein
LDSCVLVLGHTMIRESLRLRSAKPLTREEYLRSDELYAEYISRPQHRNRLTKTLKACLRAAANSVSRHGLPPGYNARLAYRMHKKRRAKQLAIAIYGDPLAKCSLDVMDPITKP